MKNRLFVFLIAFLFLMSCTPLNGTAPGASATSASQEVATNTANSVNSTNNLPSPTALSTPTPAAPTPTSTPSAPPDAVVVNTFEQDVYPFKPSGHCSLGEAIQSVLLQQVVDACVLPPGSHTVYMPTGTYTLTQSDNAPVVLYGTHPFPDRQHLDPAGFPVVANTLIILGNGSTIERTGSNKFGIFQVFVAGNLTLKDLTISGGDTSASNHSSVGGAIDDEGGSLALDQVTLIHNTGKENGGALAIAIGTATIINSTITQNTATFSGGGIDDEGTLTIKDSVISSNAVKVVGIDGGGGIVVDGSTAQLTLDNSQVVGNIGATGGGIYNNGGSVQITNHSVVSGNVAMYKFGGMFPNGGGGINSIPNNSQLTIDNSYIIGNQAPYALGGGIIGGGGGGSMNITGSVLSGNSSMGGGAVDAVHSPVSINGSCILDNQATYSKAYNGIEIDSIDPITVDATQNWWGTSAPSISKNVKASPQLSNAPDICASSIPTPFPVPTYTLPSP
ncbi:MAG TPA: hypothetical protein VIN60_03135 [Anaerolineales bacterium]